MPDATNRWPALSPLDRWLGLQLVDARPEVVIAEVPVTGKLLQPDGVVHPAVYDLIIKTTTNIGAAMQAGPKDRIIGFSSNTRFFNTTKKGTLSCQATPENRTGEFLLWKGRIADDTEEIICESLVNLRLLPSTLLDTHRLDNNGKSKMNEWTESTGHMNGYSGWTHRQDRG